MLTLTTSDGRVHSGNDWRVLLETAAPTFTAEAALQHLVDAAKKLHAIDVTFEEQCPDPLQLLMRLHECQLVNVSVIDA